MYPAGIGTESISFRYLCHPYNEILLPGSLILLHMNAGMHQYTHAQPRWRAGSRSSTNLSGLICLKRYVCWMEPSPKPECLAMVTPGSTNICTRSSLTAVGERSAVILAGKTSVPIISPLAGRASYLRCSTFNRLIPAPDKRIKQD